MAFHICMAADENYVKYAAVLMTSIVRHIDKNISFESLFDYQSNNQDNQSNNQGNQSNNQDNQTNKQIINQSINSFRRIVEKL